MSRHPIQPLEKDDTGVIRFKRNAIVEYLLDHGGIDLNEIASKEFPREDLEQFAQLIGYSLSGFADLSYVSDETFAMAERSADTGETTEQARIATCSACRWWRLDENDSYNAIVSPWDPATYDQIDPTEEGGEAKIAEKFGHAVRRCRCHRLKFYQRPERDTATVCDGSGYKADLITGPDFGCTLFEPSAGLTPCSPRNTFSPPPL